jgi:hypothetical protein
MNFDEMMASAWSQLDRLAHKFDDHSDEADLPMELFHYTSAEGFIGIVDSRVLWASDMLCLNDASEAEYATQMITDAVNGNLYLLPAEHRQAFDESLRSAFRMYTPFVACFCEDGDLLSQWRGYGGSGAGFALGFSRSWLSCSALVDDAKFRLLRVTYSPAKQRHLIQEYLQGAATVSRNLEISEDGRWFWGIAANAMAHLVVAFKNPVFEAENEWRLVNPTIITGEYYGHRRSGHRIVPYVRIPIQENAAITSLVRGPYFVDDRGSEDLLRYSGFKAAGNTRNSKIPLRP